MPLPRKLLNDDEELLVEMRPHWIFFAGPLAAAVAVYAAIGVLLILWHRIPGWTTYPLLAIAAVPTIWLLGRLLRWRTYVLALTTTRILVRHGILNRDTVQLRLQRITEINLAQLFWERVIGTGRLVIDVQGEDDAVILEFVRKPAIVQRVVNSQINELVGGGKAEPVPPELRPDPRYPEHRPAPPSDDTPPHGTTSVPSGFASEDDTEPTAAPPDFAEPAPAPPAPAPAPPAGATHSDIATRLIELDDLRQRGILSDEEFNAKKAQLLDRI
jgi:membrane protein YdbS with pleckstrin-like domain